MKLEKALMDVFSTRLIASLLRRAKKKGHEYAYELSR